MTGYERFLRALVERSHALPAPVWLVAGQGLIRTADYRCPLEVAGGGDTVLASARALGLKVGTTVTDIVRAADHQAHYDRSIRDDLLKAVGLR